MGTPWAMMDRYSVYRGMRNGVPVNNLKDELVQSGHNQQSNMIKTAIPQRPKTRHQTMVLPSRRSIATSQQGCLGREWA